MYRMHVEGEADAMKLDDIIKTAIPKMKTVKGFEKYVRTVCKAEWAYEVAYVFSSLEDFKAYDGSEFREKEMMPLLATVMPLIKEDKPYSGVRVYDEE